MQHNFLLLFFSFPLCLDLGRVKSESNNFAFSLSQVHSVTDCKVSDETNMFGTKENTILKQLPKQNGGTCHSIEATT